MKMEEILFILDFFLLKTRQKQKLISLFQMIIWNNSFRKINGILITLIYVWCYKGYKRVTFDSSQLIKKGIKGVRLCKMMKKNKLLWSFSHTSLMETPMILNFFLLFIRTNKISSNLTIKIFFLTWERQPILWLIINFRILE